MRKSLIQILENTFYFYSSLGVVILLFLFATHFNGLYGQDAHEYFRYSKALHLFFTTRTNPGDYFWPLLYPLSGALLSFLLPELLSMQLISMASFIMSIFILEKILQVLFKNKMAETRLYLLLFFFLSPYLLRASIVVMSDVYDLFFITMAIYSFIRYQASDHPKHFTLFIVCMTAAIMIRYVAFVLLAIPLSVICIQFLRNFQIKYFLSTIVAAAFLVTPHFLLRHSNPAAFLHHAWLEHWSANNFFHSAFNTPFDGKLVYKFPNILFSFFNWVSPAYIFTGAIFILFIRKKYFQSPVIKLILASALIYSFFLAGIPQQNLRYQVLSFPLILILLFPAAISMAEKISARINKSWVIACIVIVQAGLCIRTFMPFIHYNHLEKSIAAEIKNYPGNYPVYTFEMEGALHSYNTANKVIGLWSGRTDSISSPALLLFNENKFALQWEGTNVMNNYNGIKRSKKIIPLKSFDDGWKLSEIE